MDTDGHESGISYGRTPIRPPQPQFLRCPSMHMLADFSHQPAFLPEFFRHSHGAALAATRRMTNDKRQPVLLHRELTERIIGCFYAVYRELGQGFSEAVFRRAMVVALQELGIRAKEEARLQVTFRGVVIGTFWADIIVEGVVLVEIKALPELDGRATAQLLNYLKASGGGVGLLLNFGHRPEFKRLIMGDPAKTPSFRQ
jgi:GxxExxY protein